MQNKEDVIDILKVLAVVVLAISMCGCSQVKYIPVEISKVDSTMQVFGKQLMKVDRLLTDYRKESQTTKETIIRDSVVVVLNDVGDVVSKEIIHISDKTTDSRELVSTIQTKVDSILDVRLEHLYSKIDKEPQTPIPVEKELTKWQRFRMDYFGYLCGLVLILLLWIFRKPIIRMFFSWY